MLLRGERPDHQSLLLSYGKSGMEPTISLFLLSRLNLVCHKLEKDKSRKSEHNLFLSDEPVGFEPVGERPQGRG